MINQRKQSSGMLSVDGSKEGNRGTGKSRENRGLFEYCKATPESREWQAYQIQRVLSIRELKRRNLKVEKQTVEGAKSRASNQKVNKHLHNIDPTIGVLEIKKTTEPKEHSHKRSGIQAILKKVTKRTFHSQPKDTSNVTWKEPLADTKFLPVGWMKVPVVSELHEKQVSSCEKFLVRSEISSAESKEKRKSETAGKQLSINFTERSGKNKKPHKRNNGKTNLSKPITNGEHPDNSTQVNKTGRLNNAEANKMNSGNSSKYGIRMSAATLAKSPQKETTFQIGVPPTTGESLFKQTLKDDSTSSAFKVNRTGTVTFVGVKHDHVISDNNNNNSVFTESTATIPSNEINHIEGKASAWNIHESNSDVLQRKKFREAKTHGGNDVSAYSIHRNDSNGNVIVCAPTQRFTKRTDTRNSTGDETVKDVFQESAQTGKEDKMNEVERKNDEMKPVDYKERFIQKNKLIYSPSENVMSSPEKQNLAQGVYINSNQDQESDFSMPHYEIKRRSRQLNVLESLLKHFKPPKLPEIEVCNVLPGTAEWQKYWDQFNQKLGEYYSSVDKYSKQMDDLLVDDDGYEYIKELRKCHQEERALKISMGMTLPKPPLIRHPLKETIDIGGYVIRPLGGVVEQASVSTCDHGSFRLEIPCDKLDSGLDGINIDTKFNIMTIAIPSGHKVSPFIKLVQIAVPTFKKVENLEIGHPLYNGGKIVITGK